MQIKIDLKILIFLLIFHFTGQIKIYTLLMIFACIHEFGHLIAGLCVGFRIKSFEIKPIGFTISFYHSIDDYNKKIRRGNLLELKKVLVYMSGPLVNIVTSVIFFFVKGDELLRTELIYINLIIALVNLIPIYPLDGGRIMKSILCIFLGLRKAYKYTEKVSWISVIMILATSSILILKVKNYALLLMILYLFYIRIINSKVIERKIRMFDSFDTYN